MSLPIRRSDGGYGFRDRHHVLPTPPAGKERNIYVQRRLGFLLVCSLISFTCICISQIRFSLGHAPLVVFIPVVTFTVLYFGISFWVNVGTSDFDLDAHDKLVAAWEKRGEFPSIDVFLPVCGEQFELLANTWRYVSGLIYPGRLTVYVLDDGDDESIRDLAVNYKFQYLSRPAPRETKKAGNLLYGFQNSSGAYILVLDADFAPAPDMLMHLAPYFSRDPKLGIVQSPQYFRTGNWHMNWLERGAGAVQEWFYRVVQTSRQQRDAAICVGTNALYRRAALEANNGPTQIGHSEDVHTGFDLRRHGWGLRYIPVALATGVCPSVRSSFLSQQYRWCMGSMSLLGSAKFWKTKMPMRSRAGYLSGFCYYLHTAAMTFITPSIPLVLLLFYPNMIRIANYTLILPSLVFTLIVLPLWHRTHYGIFSVLAVKMLYGWAHFFAFVDIVRRKQKAWQPTGNTTSTRGMLRHHVAVSTCVWGFFTAGTWIGLAFGSVLAGGANFIPILCSGLLYLAVILYSLSPTQETELPGYNHKTAPEPGLDEDI